MANEKHSNVDSYFATHQNPEDVNRVKNVVAYLLAFGVDPIHYTVAVYVDFVMIQIDEQCGYIDKQVSKSKFEFINGTCFSIDFDDIPPMEKCIELQARRLKRKQQKKEDVEFMQ